MHPDGALSHSTKEDNMSNFDPSENLATFEHIYTHDIADFDAEVAIEINDTVHSRGTMWAVSLSCDDATVTVRTDELPDFSVRVTRHMLDDLDDDARQAIMSYLALGDVLPVMATNQDGPDKVSERAMLGQNMVKSTVTYCILAFMVIMLFNIVGVKIIP